MVCAAALAVQRVIVEDGLAERVLRQGAALETALRDRLGQHPHVGDIRGRGLLWAVELVADRETAAPFDPDLRLSARIGAEAKARGLLIYPGSGTIDGWRGDHVLLAPAYSIGDEDLDRITDVLATSLEAVLAGFPQVATV